MRAGLGAGKAWYKEGRAGCREGMVYGGQGVGKAWAGQGVRNAWYKEGRAGCKEGMV
jgi:hypothetical protein